MNGFSEFLKEYLDERGLSCRSAASMCKINRTSLSKYINGSRRPKNMDAVISLGTGIGMSDEHLQILCDCYKKDMYYKSLDRGYSVIENIYNGVFPYRKTSCVRKTRESNKCSSGGNGSLTMDNRQEIIQEISILAGRACRIQLSVDIKCADVLEAIKENCQDRKNCRIEQMIEINNNGKTNEMTYEWLERCFPMLCMECCYKVYYHLRWKMPDDDTRMNYILTDAGMIMFNSGMTYGICLSDEKYYPYYEKKYRAFCSDGRLFAKNKTNRPLEWNRMICNDVNGIQFAHCIQPDTVYIGSIYENKWFGVFEENLIAKVLEFMEKVEKEMVSG